MAFEEILSRIPGLVRSGRGWVARCPAHEDNRPSLSVTVNEGKLLLRCFKGCQFKDIIASLGIKASDCFYDPLPERNFPVHEAARYRYTDEEGRHIYDVVRMEPKDFRVQAADGKWGLNGCRKVLYRLCSVANNPSRILFIAEGEKAVDALCNAGFLATCSPGGAGNWNESYSDSLDGRGSVVVLPDNDEPGIRHAEMVSRSLAHRVDKLRVIHLPGLEPKGDPYDWLQVNKPARLKEIAALALAQDSEYVLRVARNMPTCERWGLVHSLLKEMQGCEGSARSAGNSTSPCRSGGRTSASA